MAHNPMDVDQVEEEIAQRTVVISFDGGPLNGEGGFARDTEPIQFSTGTYRFTGWGSDGDAEYEWGPTLYRDHVEGGE